MILVDTSVWIDHLHATEPMLVEMLGEDRVATHDGVVAELALGSIRERERVVELLTSLERLPVLKQYELITLVASERLWGQGLSPIDAHLLGSARLGRATIWTRDRRLRAAAVRLGIAVVREAE